MPKTNPNSGSKSMIDTPIFLLLVVVFINVFFGDFLGGFVDGLIEVWTDNK